MTEGHYDTYAAFVQAATRGHGVLVAVIGGKHGHGFSYCGTAEVHEKLPSLLREMAKMIEEQLEERKGAGD